MEHDTNTGGTLEDQLKDFLAEEGRTINDLMFDGTEYYFLDQSEQKVYLPDLYQDVVKKVI